MNHQITLTFFFLLAVVAYPQVPGDRIVPPESLFGDKYDRSDNEPEWNEYIDGKPLDISKPPVGLQLSFSKASLATLLIIAYPNEEGAMDNFMGGRNQMEKQPFVKLSPLKDVQSGKYYTTQVFGRNSCSMVISNVHFVINDPGGDLSAEKVLEWSNLYADFLKKSIQLQKTAKQPQSSSEKWTGSNGNTIMGTVVSVDQQKQSVEFITDKGERIKNLPLSRFSEPDKIKILERFTK